MQLPSGSAKERANWAAFEVMSRRFYEQACGVLLEDLGRVEHAEHTFLYSSQSYVISNETSPRLGRAVHCICVQSSSDLSEGEESISTNDLTHMQVT